MKAKTITITKAQLEEGLREKGKRMEYKLPETITLEIPDEQIECAFNCREVPNCNICEKNKHNHHLPGVSSPADLPELPEKLRIREYTIDIEEAREDEIRKTVNQLLKVVSYLLERSKQ